MEESTIASKVALTLDLPPSCIQFCRVLPEYFVVGTYNLEKEEAGASGALDSDQDDAEDRSQAVKKPQSRNGSLLVYKLRQDALILTQTTVQPSAILDLRFHPSPAHQNILAVVSSTGSLAVFKLDPTDDTGSPLQHLATSRCDDLSEDVLFLQCNWHPAIPNLIAVTTSTGLARVLTLDSAWNIKGAVDLDVQNNLEAWCIAFSPSSSQLKEEGLPVSVYCGGDDSIFRYGSYSCGCEDGVAESNTLYGPISLKGQHEAGVTAILPLSVFGDNGGRVVVTGSYDEHIRVFLIHDLAATYGAKRVELVADEGLGGGVWRLDLIDCQSSDDAVTSIRLVASCMHAGARIVEIRGAHDGRWECRVLGRFEEHKSMNYGTDFVKPAADGRVRCVSTSFYDKLLCLWDYEPM